MNEVKGKNPKFYAYVLLVLCALIAGTFFRVWRLGDLPAGFYIDEASFGYNAYSILKTGSDEFGNHYPLYTPSFGTGKNPIYLYATVISTWLFDLNEFSTRLPAALFGALTVLFTIFLCDEITGRKYSGIVAGAFLALNPWHIFFSRFAIETTSMTCFISAGFLLLLKGLKKPRLLPAAAVVLGAGFYSYAPAIPFIFVMLAGFAAIFKNEISKIPSSIKILFLALLALFCVPHIAYDAGGGEQISHFKNSFVFNSSNDNASREILRESGWPGASAPPMIMRASIFAKNYLSNYSPSYLFRNGDLSSFRSHVKGFGPFLPVAAPLLVFGVFGALSARTPGMKFLLLWFIAFPLGAAISAQYYPSATRTFNALPCFQILFASGFFYLCDIIRKRAKNDSKHGALLIAVVAGGVFIAYSLSFIVFFKRYSTEYPVYSSIDWNYGFRDAINYSEASSENYLQTVITENIPFSYIYPLYYGKMLPDANGMSLKWKGPYRVGRIGRYDVRDPYLQYNDKKQLFIIGSWERPDLLSIPVQSIKEIPSIVKVSEYVPVEKANGKSR